MLGPLKFGLQKPLAAVKAAAAPGNFELKVSSEGNRFAVLTFYGATGQTGSVDWGNGTISPVTFSYGNYTFNNMLAGSTITIKAPNSIHTLTMFQYSSFFGGPTAKITGITGTYPTGLQQLTVGFNHVNPLLNIIPNIPRLAFMGNGPSSLTTGSNLITLASPINATFLDLTASSKLTNFTFISGSPLLTGTNVKLPTAATSINVKGNTTLTSLALPSKLVSLDITNCSGITGLKLPSTLTTLRIEGSGLQSLDLTGTNVTTLNIPPSMDSQLKTVKLVGSKLKLSGLVNFIVPENSNWSIY